MSSPQKNGPDPSTEEARARILLYSFPFPPQIGGLERLTERTARGLVQRGFDVSVVTGTADEMPGGDSQAFPFRVARRPSLRDLALLIRGSDLVQLNTFNLRVFLLAKSLRRPIVWQHIDYDTIDPRGLCSRQGVSCTFAPRACWSCLRADHSRAGAARVLAAFFSKAVAARLVQSNLVASTYGAQRMRLPAAHVVPLGVDVAFFAPNGDGRSSSGLSLFFSGRHLLTKGCDVLLKALATCRQRGLDVKCVIAGDGPHRGQSQRLARDLDIADSVRFTGFVSDQALVELLRAADTTVIPATIDEYYCLAAVEAMACGTPVIAADIGSLPEIVQEGGLLFAPGDVAMLAEQICKLASDGELRALLEQRARSRAVSALSEELMIERYIDVYQETLGQAIASYAR